MFLCRLRHAIILIFKRLSFHSQIILVRSVLAKVLSKRSMMSRITEVKKLQYDESWKSVSRKENRFLHTYFGHKGRLLNSHNRNWMQSRYSSPNEEYSWQGSLWERITYLGTFPYLLELIINVLKGNRSSKKFEISLDITNLLVS